MSAVSTSMIDSYPYLCKGIVINNEDPLNLGRCKIRIPALHGNSNADASYYVWATALNLIPTTQSRGSYAIPDVNDIVWVLLEGGNDDSPVYFGGVRGTSDTPVDISKLMLYQEGEDSLFYDRVSHRFVINSGNNTIIIDKSNNSIDLKSDGVLNIQSANTINILGDSKISLNSSSVSIKSNNISLEGTVTVNGNVLENWWECNCNCEEGDS